MASLALTPMIADSKASATAARLDQFAMRRPARVVSIDWDGMSDDEARRLRALGLDRDVRIEKMYAGVFGFRDPIALKIGRMTIAIRKRHAMCILVEGGA